jgi:hypothetical protein
VIAEPYAGKQGQAKESGLPLTFFIVAEKTSACRMKTMLVRLAAPM